jgi:hypothetical protein
MATHDNSFPLMLTHRAMQSDADAMMKLGDGLATRKDLVVGVGFPIWHPVAIYEIAIRESIAIGTRIVLTPQWVHVHAHASERWCDDVSSLASARKRARHQDIDIHFGVMQPPVTQPLRLNATKW